MIAECIDRMRQGACATCDRRDACAFLRWEGLRFRPDAGARRAARPSGSAGGPLRAFLGEVAKAFEAHARPKPSAFRKAVEDRIEALLADGTARIDMVARELGYSRQTLYRRLKEEGVTFEQLVERVRRRLALRMLREQRLSVKEVAYRLGFSDPAAFSRAFKRWTGSSPSAV